MSDHGHASSGHAHTPSSGGGTHTSSGGGGGEKITITVIGLIAIVALFYLWGYKPIHKNDQQVTQSTKKIEWEEDKVDSIPFNSEFGDFYFFEAYKELQFDPAPQPLDGIDNYGNPFHVSVGEKIGEKINRDLSTNYAIKIKSCNGTHGKVAFATLREK